MWPPLRENRKGSYSLGLENKAEDKGLSRCTHAFFFKGDVGGLGGLGWVVGLWGFLRLRFCDLLSEIKNVSFKKKKKIYEDEGSIPGLSEL